MTRKQWLRGSASFTQTAIGHEILDWFAQNLKGIFRARFWDFFPPKFGVWAWTFRLGFKFKYLVPAMRSQCHQQQTRNLPKLHRHSALSSGNALFFFFSSELYQNLFVIAVCISTWIKFITTLSFFVCVDGDPVCDQDWTCHILQKPSRQRYWLKIRPTVCSAAECGRWQVDWGMQHSTGISYLSCGI